MNFDLPLQVQTLLLLHYQQTLWGFSYTLDFRHWARLFCLLLSRSRMTFETQTSLSMATWIKRHWSFRTEIVSSVHPQFSYKSWIVTAEYTKVRQIKESEGCLTSSREDGAVRSPHSHLGHFWWTRFPMKSNKTLQVGLSVCLHHLSIPLSSPYVFYYHSRKADT